MLGITGANGFVGAALMSRAELGGLRARAISRSASKKGENHELRGISSLVHCGARAHVLKESQSDPLAEFRSANRDATISLAENAAASGVRRFVFISSIGVLGVRSSAPLRPEDRPLPSEPYAISKYEAEIALGDLCAKVGMELTIIRPPLVHGPGAKGNFRLLCEAIAKRRILPVSSHNRRSFVGIDNLCDAILASSVHPTAVGKIYHVCDLGVISTYRLVELIADTMGIHSRAIRVPRWFAITAGSLIGKGKAMRRLFDDLEVDCNGLIRDVGWAPALTMEDGIRSMALNYIRHNARLG